MKYGKKALSASFTVEAAIVMTIVLWTLGFVIRESFILYDEVTGSMILEEALENTRYSPPDKEAGAAFAEAGERQRNPGLWYKNYKIRLEETGSKVKGTAVSEGWETQIEMKRHHPERFLRRIQALLEERGKPE